ncbi:MAG: GNAT family N-acetyltransferase [Candidatus Onthomonas sp.]
MNGSIHIRRLSPAELPAAQALIWTVFCQFEAPEYPPEGIQTFRAALEDDRHCRAMSFYGAYEGTELVGVLAMRRPQHIGFFFVRADRHRQGIGRQLFEAMRQDYAVQSFTVNAAPYGVPFYRRLGFVPTGPEQVTDGIRYTPMKLSLPDAGL